MLVVPAPGAPIEHRVMALHAKRRIIGIVMAAFGTAGHRLWFAVATAEELSDQGKSAGKRDCQKIFHKRRALLELVLERVRFRLLGGHDRADKFDEVHSAFIAFAAGTL